MRIDVTKAAAAIVALAASITSVHLKVTADSLELELKRAQAQLEDQFSLASVPTCDAPTEPEAPR